MEITLNLLVGQFLSGLTRAMVLFLVASGLSLIFGVMSVLNFAHGSFYMLGAFLTYEIWTVLSASNLGFIASLIIGSLIMAAIGAVIEIFLIRRTYALGHIPQLLLTYGLVLVTGDIVRMGWGGRFYSISRPQFLSGSIKILDVQFPVYNVFVILLGFGVFGGLYFLIYNTKVGMIIRAAVHDRDLVSALGINIPRVFTLVFALGIFLAGIAGGAYAPLGTIAAGMDISFLIESFAVIIVGGVGRLGGTLIGALIVGEVYSFGILVVPDLALAFVFIIMIVVLIIRPYGLFGKEIN